MLRKNNFLYFTYLCWRCLSPLHCLQVFCYGGAQNWPSYIKGMRRRSDFKKSCTFVTVFMTVLYVLTGGVGYWKLGDHNASWDKSQPITSVLSSDTWTSIMNLGLLLHCLIAYQIDLYVWTDLLLTALTPASKKESRTSVAAQKAQWFVLSTVGIAFSFAVSYLVPHFDTGEGLFLKLRAVLKGWLCAAVCWFCT